jgi:hypothetical protein
MSLQLGQTLTFNVSASDPDNDPLVYSAANLPAGSMFSPATQVFNWTPAAPGTYPGIHFEVTDGSLTDFENISITVLTGQSPPSGELTVSISTGADDGFSGSWGYYSNLSWYEAGNPGQPYSAWFRFTGITIPQGATITEARLELVQAGWSSGTHLKIFAEKAANPAAPTGNPVIASKLRTNTGVDWDSGFNDWGWHDTADFSTVIQELVNSYSYNNGVIQIIIDNDGGSGESTGEAFESGYVPRLYIKWQ